MSRYPIRLDLRAAIACTMIAMSSAPLRAQAPAVNITGLVTDSSGTPLAAAAVKLERLGYTATSGQDGRFTLTGTSLLRPADPHAPLPSLHHGALVLSVPERAPYQVSVYGLHGEELASLERTLAPGSHSLALPHLGSGLRFLKVSSRGHETWMKAFALEGRLRSAPAGAREAPASHAALAKAAAAELHDVLVITKDGYQKGYVTLTQSDTANVKVALLKTTSPKFSFFVTSMRTLQQLAGEKGFGGDLRFGETGAGAGLRGADKICATIAEMSMKGSAVKGWRAFLSAQRDAHGDTVHAIDRVGPGPWYDRTGRLLAPTKADLIAVRPKNGDPTIQLDLPNEWGIPNHRPDPTKPAEDNHHMITGSNIEGKLASETATCKDWTTSEGTAANGKPAHGYAWPRGGRVGTSGSNWMATGQAGGCGAGIEIVENGPGAPGATFIGNGGGYGGFYCFALSP